MEKERATNENQMPNDKPGAAIPALSPDERDFLTRGHSASKVLRPARIRRNLAFRRAKREKTLELFGQWMN